jgi:hypothetical protein
MSSRVEKRRSLLRKNERKAMLEQARQGFERIKDKRVLGTSGEFPTVHKDSQRSDGCLTEAG